MHSSKECLLLRHVLSNLDCDVIIMQVSMLCAVASQEVATFLRGDENLAEVPRERLAVSARSSPLELDLLL